MLRWFGVFSLIVALTACQSKTELAKEEAKSSFWCHFYGTCAEESALCSFYGNCPNKQKDQASTDDTLCGFYGNCKKGTVEVKSCGFYGNCDSAQMPAPPVPEPAPPPPPPAPEPAAAPAPSTFYGTP